MLHFIANGIVFTGLVGTAYVTKLWYFTRIPFQNAVLTKRGSRFVHYDFVESRPYVEDMFYATGTVDILTGEIMNLRASSKFNSVRQGTKRIEYKLEREANVIRYIASDLKTTSGSPVPFLWTCKPEHGLAMQKLGCDYQSKILPPGSEAVYRSFFDKIHDQKLAEWLKLRLQQEGGYKRVLETDMDRVTPIRMIVHTSHT